MLKKTRELANEDEATIAHNLERLINLLDYRFMALEIIPTVDEELVAEIFVRINSQGAKLSTADFILTLLSVFWDEGRAQLEAFARESRLPAGPGERSSFNHVIAPDADQLLRVSVRNDAAHFRAVPLQQLRSCQVACEELTTLLAVAERSE